MTVSAVVTKDIQTAIMHCLFSHYYVMLQDMYMSLVSPCGPIAEYVSKLCLVAGHV